MRYSLSTLLGVVLAVTAAYGSGTPSSPTPVGGSGHSDTPMADVIDQLGYQVVISGDVGVIIVGDWYHVNAANSVYDDLRTLLSDGTTHVVGGNHNTVVTDTGAPGANLVSEWKDQDGITQRVDTRKGAGEDTDDFVKRHKETVRLMKKAFPPN